MKRLIGTAFSIVAAVLLVSCGKPPETDIQQAADALAAAETAGAPEYAPDAWSQAKQSMERLNAELASQDHRFRLLRNFSRARRLAGEVTNSANQAAAEAGRRKAELRTEVAGMIAEVRSSLRSARAQLSALSGSRALNITDLRSKLDRAEGLLNRAQSDMDAEQFDSAMAGAGQAREDVVDVLRAIERVSPRPAVKKR
jgi:hypothetical protein